MAGSNTSTYDTTGKSLIWNPTPAVREVINDVKVVIIKWKRVKGAARYQVYRRLGDGAWRKLGESVTKLIYKDKTAKSGKTYSYGVQALDKNGKAISGIGVDKTMERLTVPRLAKAIAKNGQVTFTWKKVAGADGYIVYRKEGKGKWKKIASPASGRIIKCVDTTVKKGKTYCYTVQAISDTGSKSKYDTTGKKVTAK